MMEQFQIRRLKKGDSWLSVIVFALIIWGLISIYSASVVISLENFGTPYYYLTKQAIALGIGLVVWFITQFIDYHKWRRFALAFFLVSLVLLAMVFLPSDKIAPVLGGAKRWLFFDTFNFQPSELAKISFVIFLSAWLSSRKDEIGDFKKVFLPYWLISGLVIFLIFLEPDVGTALIFMCIALGLYFVAGARLSHFLLIFIFSIVVVFILGISSPYRMHRFLAFLNPSFDPQGIGYHSRNLSIAIGSGGLWGQGFGNSKQKYLYLPEAHTDSIFAIIAEELGFIRAMFIPILFGLLIWRGILIARKTGDDFGRFLAIGIVSWFGAQVIINLGGMLGVLPLTGVPLPFLSFGGTSLVISLISMGVLLNISKQIRNI